jgi:plastocyanin
MISRNGVLITVVLATCVALAAASCGGSGSTGYGTTPSTMPSGTGSSGGTTAADVTIQIVGMSGANSFNPNPGAVKVGQTVSWHNADMVGHTATGSGFDTGAIASGATSAPIKFDTAGTLSYRCSFHPSMTGTLTVNP